MGRALALAFIAALFAVCPSTQALASNFKTYCRPPAPDTGPPRTQLPLDGELCNNGQGPGTNCTAGVQATDEIEIINILPGDNIKFEFTIDEGPATFTNTVQIGNGDFDETNTQFFSSNVSGEVNYGVVDPDQDINNGLKFQLQLPNSVSNRQFVSYTVSCQPGPQQNGFIKIEKILDPTSDPDPDNPDFNFEIDDASAGSLKVGQETDPIPVTPGSHTVEELDPPENWTLTDIDCGNDQNPATVNVAAGQIVTCAFTNKFTNPDQEKSFIRIQKLLDPTSDPGANDPDFNYKVDGNSTDPLKIDGETLVEVTAGEHTVQELAPPENWTLTGINCGNDQNPATVDVGEGETVLCQFTNKFETPKGTLKVKKKTVGGNGSFSFSVTQPASPSTFQLVGGETKIFSNLPVGDYTIEETNLPPDWSVNDINCGGKGIRTGNSITVNVGEGETVICRFKDFKKHDDPMEEETKRFIYRRVDNLLTHGPDRARMLRRLQEQRPTSLKDGPLKFSGQSSTTTLSGAAGNSMMKSGVALSQNLGTNSEQGLPWVEDSVTTRTSDEVYGVTTGPTSASSSMLSSIASQLAPVAAGDTSFKFGTSLSEMRAKAAEAEARDQQKKMQAAGMEFAGQPYTNPFVGLRPGFDIWVEGHISRYNDDVGGINREGDFRILYIGADYVVAPGILVGALVQVDDTNEDIDDPIRAGEIDGTGWMVGPYLGIRLHDKLFFDARAAWGQSDNDIWLADDDAGYRSGSFETDRWLATATLTGVHYHGAWRFSPEVGLAYGHESYGTYVNSLGQIVEGADANIGRMTGGVEVGYRSQMSNGTIVEPMVGISGIWNFDSDDLVINGVVEGTSESRALIEGGLLIRTPSGWGIRAAANYDGIGGDDFDSYGGSLWVNIPLNH